MGLQQVWQAIQLCVRLLAIHILCWVLVCVLSDSTNIHIPGLVQISSLGWQETCSQGVVDTEDKYLPSASPLTTMDVSCNTAVYYRSRLGGRHWKINTENSFHSLAKSVLVVIDSYSLGLALFLALFFPLFDLYYNAIVKWSTLCSHYSGVRICLDCVWFSCSKPAPSQPPWDSNHTADQARNCQEGKKIKLLPCPDNAVLVSYIHEYVVIWGTSSLVKKLDPV